MAFKFNYTSRNKFIYNINIIMDRYICLLYYVTVKVYCYEMYTISSEGVLSLIWAV